MVDIAMCNRRDCGKKWSCFRYLAFPSEYQAYLQVQQYDVEEGCEYYWQCKSKRDLRMLNKINK